MPSRFAAVAALVFAAATTVVQAQVNQTYVTGLIAGLNALNLTSSTAALTTISGTPAGQSLLAKLSSGAPYTFLVPDNDAWVGVAPIFHNDPTWLGQALAYHVLNGSFGVDSIANAPNTTIKVSLLTDPNVVKLGPNGTPQNIGLRKYTTNGTATAYVSHQDYPSFIRYSTGYQNLYIHVVSAVVDLPPQLNDFLTLPNYGENANVKTLTAIVKATPNITQLTTAQDITVFLPSDSAFAAAVAKYGPSALSNLTEVTNVLKDHVIQGHAIFTGANQTSYTTAAGNSLTVGLGGTSSVTGTVVFFSGYNVANIVEPNIILQNGVAHIIDQVLLNKATTPSRKRSPSRIYGGIAI